MPSIPESSRADTPGSAAGAGSASGGTFAPGGGAPGGAAPGYVSSYRPAPLPSKPRRVRGGIRLMRRDAGQDFGWAGARFLSIVRAAARDEAMAEGAEYAHLGQTRAMAIEPGRIVASVQGRAPRAYRTTIELMPIDADSWEKLIRSMVEQALHAAKLLAGELPPAAEELFASQGLHMFPQDAGALRSTCTCTTGEGADNWCKHACCVALLTADALRRDPFQWFTFRGIEGEELLERIRQHRAALRPGGAGQSAGRAGPGGRPMGSAQGLAGSSDSPSLESCIDFFWEAGLGLDELETRAAPPVVSHALLKRLGATPFTDSRFPMLGLLATCYDTISSAAMRESDPLKLPPAPKEEE